MIDVQVYRYHPEAQHQPRMQSYSVDDSFRERMVLDVLEHLHETDQTLCSAAHVEKGSVAQTA